jgi:multiple sugar transport system substrate-binding protein
LKLYNDKAAWNDYFNQLGTTSQQAIGVGMQSVGYSDQDAYKAFVRQSFQTNAKPDLFTWWVGGALQDLVTEGVVGDTTDLWQQAIKDGNATAEEAKYFTVNGRQYCVPLIFSPWVIYYNTRVFKSAGIEAPTSWDQLVAAAGKLKAAGITSFPDYSGVFSYAPFQLILSGSDPHAYAGLGDGSVKFTDPRVMSAMQTWASMIKAGYFAAPGATKDLAGGLKSGAVAMEYLGTWFRGNLAKAGMTAEDYGMILPPGPSSSSKVMVAEPGPLCSATKSPNSAQAGKFLSWVFRPDAQSKWSSLRSDVSFNPKATISDPSLAALNKTANSGDYQIQNMFYNELPLPVATEALKQFDAFIANPSNPMTQLTKIQDAADKYWSAKK